MSKSKIWVKYNSILRELNENICWSINSWSKQLDLVMKIIVCENLLNDESQFIKQIQSVLVDLELFGVSQDHTRVKNLLLKAKLLWYNLEIFEQDFNCLVEKSMNISSISMVEDNNSSVEEKERKQIRYNVDSFVRGLYARYDPQNYDWVLFLNDIINKEFKKADEIWLDLSDLKEKSVQIQKKIFEDAIDYWYFETKSKLTLNFYKILNSLFDKSKELWISSPFSKDNMQDLLDKILSFNILQNWIVAISELKYFLEILEELKKSWRDVEFFEKKLLKIWRELYYKKLENVLNSPCGISTLSYLNSVFADILDAKKYGVAVEEFESKWNVLAKWVYESIVQRIFEKGSLIKDSKELKTFFSYIKDAEKYWVDISNVTIYLNHIAKSLSEKDWTD